MKTMLAIAALTLAVALPATSHAAAPAPMSEPPPAVEQPGTPPPPAVPRWGATAVRLDLSGQLFGSSLAGVEVSHRFGELVGLDLAVGENDMGYGHTGTAVDAMARLYLFNEASGGVSLAAGPWFRTAKEFGTVAFASGEIAGEYRPRGGISVLVGGGMSVALNDSGQATCPDAGWLGCFLWRDHYAAGDTSFNLRLAVGASF